MPFAAIHAIADTPYTCYAIRISAIFAIDAAFTDHVITAFDARGKDGAAMSIRDASASQERRCRDIYAAL